MPPVWILAAAASAVAIVGVRQIARMSERAQKRRAEQAEANKTRQPDSRGSLVWDDATKSYRPQSQSS